MLAGLKRCDGVLRVEAGRRHDDDRVHIAAAEQLVERRGVLAPEGRRDALRSGGLGVDHGDERRLGDTVRDVLGMPRAHRTDTDHAEPKRSVAAHRVAPSASCRYAKLRSASARGAVGASSGPMTRSCSTTSHPS